MKVELELDRETVRRLRLLCEYHEVGQDEMINSLILEDLEKGKDSHIRRHLLAILGRCRGYVPMGMHLRTPTTLPDLKTGWGF